MKYTKLIIGIVLIMAVLSACGTSKSQCKTRGKTRTEMGFM